MNYLHAILETVVRKQPCVLYEVMCDLLICASGSSGLHDKQDLKVLIKSGS